MKIGGWHPSRLHRLVPMMGWFLMSTPTVSEIVLLEIIPGEAEQLNEQPVLESTGVRQCPTGT